VVNIIRVVVVVVITVIYCAAAEDIGNHNDMTNGVRFGRKCFCATHRLLCCTRAGVMNNSDERRAVRALIYKWTSSVVYFGARVIFNI